ncbi:MAG: hypothetical protein ACRENM_03410 [Candidatus Dormibacteraceae bacterium]
METPLRRQYLTGLLLGLAVAVLLFVPGIVASVISMERGHELAASGLIGGATVIVFILALLTLLALVAVSWRPADTPPADTPPSHTADPEAELRLRFARGEINEREFKRMREVLADGNV